MKRILFTGDWHCGDVFGLTPPDWYIDKYKVLQEQLWGFWKMVTEEKYDAAVVNGDLIDGSIDKIGMWMSGKEEQVEMAQTALSEIKAKKTYIVLGTPLHTGGEAIYEKLIGDAQEELRLEVEGVKFHIKHRITGSKTGYGQESLLAREAIGQTVYDKEILGLPPPQLVVRSHAHRYCHIQNEIANGILIPCLQFPYSWYGATISKWQYAMGVVVIQVDNQTYTVEPHLIKINTSKWRQYEKI